ncbi:MHC-I C-terminus family protein [Mycena kentingensis (nom. inval.)]|nr:MHC-I C-terminus family protein [Mycena kentingensis (nom. inval.)]
MLTSFSTLAPELHHRIVGELSPTRAAGGCYDLSRYNQLEVVPDVKTIARLSRTCIALYNNVHWMLFEACRTHVLLNRRALYHAISHSQPELLTKLASAGAAFDVDIQLAYASLRPYTIDSSFWRTVDDDELQVRPLQIATNNGDLVIVRKLLDIYGPTQAAAEVYNVARNFNYTWSALDMAILRLDLEIVRLFTSASLLRECTTSKSNGVDVNFRLPGSGKLYASAIESALRANNLDSLRLLLEHGANTETYLQYPRCYMLDHILPNLPLHLAVKNGDIQLATLLLDAGADINAKDEHGHGALTYTFDCGSKEKENKMCRFLLAAGATAAQQDVGAFGRTPLFGVCGYGNVDRELLRLLLHAGCSALIDKRDLYGNTAIDDLMSPADLRKPPGPPDAKTVREVLLPHVKDPEHRKRIETWLGKRYGPGWVRRQFYACAYTLFPHRMRAKYGEVGTELHQHIASFLIKSTIFGALADINALSQTCTALRNSIAWMLFDACRTDPFIAERALRYAICQPDVKLLDRLVAEGVSLHVLYRQRPLQLAAAHMNADFVKRLLQLLGERAAGEAYGVHTDEFTALDRAARNADVETVRVLAAVRPPRPADEPAYQKYLASALQEAMRARTNRPDNISAVADLLISTFGADVNFVYASTTALCVAVEHGDIAALQFLLARGADPNVWDSAIRIPLHQAVRRSDENMVRLLLDSGADVNAKDVGDVGVLQTIFELAFALR